MRNLMFCATLAVALAAPAASAGVTLTGHLEAGEFGFQIDSAFFAAEGEDEWFQTEGWEVGPMESDSFVFPSFVAFPEHISLMGFSFEVGSPVMLRLDRPEREVWYAFDPPFEGARVMFTAATGVEQRPETGPRPRLSVVPSVIRTVAVISAPVPGRVEVVDAAGNLVRTIAVAGAVRWAADDDSGRLLAEGVYFCRFVAGDGVTVRKVLVTR